MNALNKCPYCETRYSGRSEVCSECQEHFKGMFLCNAEKLTYEQKLELGRFIMYLKKKDDAKKCLESRPILDGSKLIREFDEVEK